MKALVQVLRGYITNSRFLYPRVKGLIVCSIVELSMDRSGYGERR
jgi:hypothetical protein